MGNLETLIIPQGASDPTSFFLFLSFFLSFNFNERSCGLANYQKNSSNGHSLLSKNPRGETIKRKTCHLLDPNFGLLSSLVRHFIKHLQCKINSIEEKGALFHQLLHSKAHWPLHQSPWTNSQSICPSRIPKDLLRQSMLKG